MSLYICSHFLILADNTTRVFPMMYNSELVFGSERSTGLTNRVSWVQTNLTSPETTGKIEIRLLYSMVISRH